MVVRLEFRSLKVEVAIRAAVILALVALAA